MAASALAYPVFLVLWKWQRSGTPVTLRTAPASVRTSRGTATPIVSASATSSTPASTHWRTMSVTRSGRTSPSNGQPNAAPDGQRHAAGPASRAAPAMPAVAAIASAVVIPWFFAENVSVATTTMLISSTPAATARSIPRRFSTRPL